jgi:hypothetical protein
VWQARQPLARVLAAQGQDATVSAAIQPGGDIVAIRSSTALRLWSAATGNPIVAIAAAPPGIGESEAVEFSANGRTMLAALPGEGGAVVLQLPAEGELLALAEGLAKEQPRSGLR